MVARREPRVPAWPLVRTVRARAVLEHLPKGDPARRAFYRAVAEGELTVWAADQFAVTVLGEHPSSVWPDWFERADSDVA